MKNIKVVIGANFGDEGKGLMTDYFAAEAENGIVVRFNGGTQAGHTVTTGDGKRHVFGHIGSGSFAGVPTFLSSYFIVNPMAFVKEYRFLCRQTDIPQIYLDENCIVTTPYDMMINQAVEQARGESRHGSCGFGINETITRSLCGDRYLLLVKDLQDEAKVREVLDRIRREYVKDRLEQLGVRRVMEPYASLVCNDNVIDNYLGDIREMMGLVSICDYKVLFNYETLIFEGAQGLLLDQNHKYFPHVTRSNTGMQNVSEILRQLGYENESIEIVYATRAYMTRHGAGPFPTETESKPYSRIEDLTNVPNPYQGTLRFGLLDLEALSETIRDDLEHTKGLNCEVNLAITCLDQLEERVDFYMGKSRKNRRVEDFIDEVMKTVGVNRSYLSYGPTRNTISGRQIG